MQQMQNDVVVLAIATAGELYGIELSLAFRKSDHLQFIAAHTIADQLGPVLSWTSRPSCHK